MSRVKAMLKNTILLTGTSLLMRTVGISFQVYLTKRIGASGIGLFQLIMSVSMLAATFALSGIRFATTRLVSEELGKGNPGGIKKAVVRCLVYALAFGSAAMAALYFNAEIIGTGGSATAGRYCRCAYSRSAFPPSRCHTSCRVISQRYAASSSRLPST
jgi:stage V sporulation protein B